MTKQGNPDLSSTPTSLDDLSALCDHMVSLSRAGVPLDAGLVQLAEDLPGRLSRKANRIGEKLQAGQSLADVVADDVGPFPAVYKSVVEAGLRSGQLTVALEGFARLARQLAELRRLVLSALVYPLLLLVLMCAISFVLLRRLGPVMRDGLVSLRGPRNEDRWLTEWLDLYVIGSNWFWVLPTLLLALGLFWFFSTRRAGASGRRADWVNWVPGAGRLLRNSRLQAFTDVLALLVKQRLPLEQSLRLAGNASGDPCLQADAEQLADQIARGDTKSCSGAARGIPLFLRWSLLNNQRPENLEASLVRASETYKRRTQYSIAWLRRTLPIIFSVTLGGFVSLLYAAMVLAPWYAILQSLGGAMEAM